MYTQGLNVTYTSKSSTVSSGVKMSNKPITCTEEQFYRTLYHLSGKFVDTHAIMSIGFLMDDDL